MNKPTIFIGSSVEGLQIADGIETNLQYDCIPNKWPHVFESGQSNLSNLINAAERADFAAFVFSPEDILIMRNKEFSVARDNVIFELGLFMGALGRERTFIFKPSNASNLHLPSDLDGIGYLNYSDEYPDFKIRTSIPCNEIRDRVRKLKKRTKTEQLVNVEKRKFESEILYIFTRYKIAAMLFENHSIAKRMTISEMHNQSGLNSRKLIVDFVKDMEKEKIIEREVVNERTSYKLSTLGMRLLKSKM